MLDILHELCELGQLRTVADAQVAFKRDGMVHTFIIYEGGRNFGGIALARDGYVARYVHRRVGRAIEVDNEAVGVEIRVITEFVALGEGARGIGLPLVAAVEIAVEDHGISGLFEGDVRALGYEIHIGDTEEIVVRSRSGLASPVSEHRLVHLESIALLGLALVEDAQPVVFGLQRFAGGHGGIERQLDRRLRGQQQRESAALDVGGSLGGNLYVLVNKRVVLSCQVDITRGRVCRDQDVVVSQKHGVEVDQAFGRGDVERVDAACIVFRIDYRTDRGSLVVVRELVLESGLFRTSSIVVRRARRQ